MRWLNALRRRTRSTGLTLVLWAANPAQRDLSRALRKIGAARNGPIVHSERSIGKLTSDQVRPLLAQAKAKQRSLIVEAGLLPETALRPFGERGVQEVRRILTRLDVQRVRIVVLASPHDQLLEAVYVSRAEGGVAGDFEAYLQQFDRVDLSYAPLVQALSDIPQVQTVAVVDWAIARKSLRQLLEQILNVALDRVPADALKEYDRPARIRGYSSRRGVRVALAMHEFVETGKERGLVRRMVRQTFPARRARDLRYLTDEQRKRIKKRYRDDSRLYRAGRG